MDEDISIKGYNCIRSDRRNFSHGEVCLNVAYELKTNTIKAVPNVVCEALLVKIKIGLYKTSFCEHAVMTLKTHFFPADPK